MSRILLADDSPHAQRMGERILREEGFEVVSLTDGETALLRMADADPDVIVADAFLPGKSGIDLCRYVKSHPQHRHVRVVMTAGLLEQLDEEEATLAGCDGILKKPFEASVLVRTVKPLVSEAKLARGRFSTGEKPPAPPQSLPADSKPVAAKQAAAQPEIAARVPSSPAPPPPIPEAPSPANSEPPVLVAAPQQPPPVAPSPSTPAPVQLDPELVQAAVTLAIDAAMPALVREITQRVLTALETSR